MKRTTSKSALTETEVKVTVRLESEPCEIGSMEARRLQLEMLRLLASSADLMNCGYAPFQRLTMRHTGEQWVIEMEAIASE